MDVMEMETNQLQVGNAAVIFLTRYSYSTNVTL